MKTLLAAMVAAKLGQHVQDVFERHGALMAIVTLFFAMVFVQAVGGWIRAITRK